ncbi:hypothetical protein J19TS2_59920 [Cohnella xylanilytica]|nr:hypothetical protein J19TS2_59920 [Cohnella xylanilytica]
MRGCTGYCNPIWAVRVSLAANKHAVTSILDVGEGELASLRALTSKLEVRETQWPEVRAVTAILQLE